MKILHMKLKSGNYRMKLSILCEHYNTMNVLDETINKVLMHQQQTLYGWTWNLRNKIYSGAPINTFYTDSNEII